MIIKLASFAAKATICYLAANNMYLLYATKRYPNDHWDVAVQKTQIELSDVIEFRTEMLIADHFSE